MLRAASLTAIFAVCVLCVGCAQFPKQFTVETRHAAGDEPMIYAPGTTPGQPLSIQIPDVELACVHRPVDLVINRVGSAPVPVQFALSRRLIDQRDLATTSISVYAKFDEANYRLLADQIAPRRRNPARPHGFAKSIRQLMVAALEEGTGCGLALRGASNSAARTLASEYAAERILRGLPRAYSTVLGHAFNHQITGERNTSTPAYGNNGFSLDILGGMRLHLENSVPIPPAGINTGGGHPSSFAAPTFVYFNPITRPEICDVDVSVRIGSAEHLCFNPKNTDEDTVYLSPSSGILRYGARQVDKLATREFSSLIDERRGVHVSNIIDLYEQSASGNGAWKYWRLWFPYSRPSNVPTPITDVNGGAPDHEVAPVLIAANDWATLEWLTQRPEARPCTLPDAAIDRGSAAGGRRRLSPGDPVIADYGQWQCYYLHFRVAPIPEIALRVNGAEHWVPVGTSLHEVLAPLLQGEIMQDSVHIGAPYGEGSPNAAAAAALAAELGRRRVLERIRVTRTYDGVSYPVRADNLDDRRSTSRFLRLQLLPGDNVTW